MTTKGIIIKNIKGERYLLTSRRIVELDSEDAKEKEPWYATNGEIRKAAKQLPHGYIKVHSRTGRGTVSVRGTASVVVEFGKVKLGEYTLGCAAFDFKTFKKILRNAGVQGTTTKAFAAKAGA